MTPCPGLPRWVGTRRINHSGFCWSRHDGVAVASGEPCASYLHFAPEDNHASTSSVKFVRAGCPSWHPTNRVQVLKAIISVTNQQLMHWMKCFKEKLFTADWQLANLVPCIWMHLVSIQKFVDFVIMMHAKLGNYCGKFCNINIRLTTFLQVNVSKLVPEG